MTFSVLTLIKNLIELKAIHSVWWSAYDLDEKLALDIINHCDSDYRVTVIIKSYYPDFSY